MTLSHLSENFPLLLFVNKCLAVASAIILLVVAMYAGYKTRTLQRCFCSCIGVGESTTESSICSSTSDYSSCSDDTESQSSGEESDEIYNESSSSDSEASSKCSCSSCNTQDNSECELSPSCACDDCVSTKSSQGSSSSCESSSNESTSGSKRSIASTVHKPSSKSRRNNTDKDKVSSKRRKVSVSNEQSSKRITKETEARKQETENINEHHQVPQIMVQPTQVTCIPQNDFTVQIPCINATQCFHQDPHPALNTLCGGPPLQTFMNGNYIPPNLFWGRRRCHSFSTSLDMFSKESVVSKDLASLASTNSMYPIRQTASSIKTVKSYHSSFRRHNSKKNGKKNQKPPSLPPRPEVVTTPSNNNGEELGPSGLQGTSHQNRGIFTNGGFEEDARNQALIRVTQGSTISVEKKFKLRC